MFVNKKIFKKEPLENQPKSKLKGDNLDILQLKTDLIPFGITDFKSKNKPELKIKPIIRQKIEKSQPSQKLTNKNLDFSQLKEDLVAFGIKNYNPKIAPKEKKLTTAITKKLPKPINLKTDNKKRSFLKLAGAVGLGLAATSLIPKKAQALVFGSTPASNVVGIKNNSNVRIDPATEGTATSIKTATEASKIATDSIKTNTDTLVTNTNKFTFSGDNLMTVTSGGTDVVGLKDSVDTRINPVTDDTVILLRRMVKLMESQNTVDANKRQRITVDLMGENTSGLLDTGTATGTQGLMALVDTTKYGTWIENQWSYFAVKITGGTGLGQIRLIDSNTTTALTLFNSWATQPDETSTYGIYDLIFTSSDFGTATGTQGLNTLTDTTKTWTVNAWTNYAVRIYDGLGSTQIRLIASNTANALTYLRPSTVQLGITPNLDTGTATGTQSVTTLSDTSKTWTVNAWASKIVIITSGTGADQAQIISSNTATVLTLQNTWAIQPDATSTYSIRSLPTDSFVSGTATGIQANDTVVDTTKTWTVNAWSNYLVKITSGTGAGQVRQISSNTATVLTLATVWTVQPDTTSTYGIYPMPSRTYCICIVPSVLTDVGTSAGCPRVALGSDSVVGTVGFYAIQQQFGDRSHKVYNDAIRNKINFS